MRVMSAEMRARALDLGEIIIKRISRRHRSVTLNFADAYLSCIMKSKKRMPHRRWQSSAWREFGAWHRPTVVWHGLTMARGLAEAARKLAQRATAGMA